MKKKMKLRKSKIFMQKSHIK